MIKKQVYTDLEEIEGSDSTINMADYYFFKNAFTDEEVERIKKISMKYPAMDAGTGQDASAKQEESVRKSTVRWLHDDIGELDWVYERLFNMTNEANNHLWDFNLSHAGEVLQYTEYPENGGHYDWHIDCGHNMQAQRKISITVQLNDDYDGGELQLWRGQTPATAHKEKGTVVIFPSYMLHRVAPVTKGVRNSLVLWIGGDHYR
jgi:PKHD-type hydroxylase